MLATLLVVLPIFALIFVGWAARKAGILGAQAVTALNRFVVYIALPALLFDIVAHSQWRDIWQPGFILAFGGAAFLLFGATIILARLSGYALADGAVMGLGAGYANTAFIGFPLTLAIFGPASQPLTLVATILTVILLFALASILVEVTATGERHPGRVALKAGRSLVTNPIIVAPALGALVQIGGFALPVPIETFLHLLAPVAPPTALVVVGLFIAGPQVVDNRDTIAITLLSIAKLLVQPALTWAIGTALRLPPPLLHTAVLIAALPTGTGSFMLAKLHEREASVTSRTILITTLVSVLTVTLYLWWIGQ